MNRQLGTFKTASNLSSETLFHFTNSFNNLQLILNNGFQAGYIYEKLPGRVIAYLAKTVCFCDIPLGQIKEHVNWYGTYAIGIKRKIAKINGVSPVHYIHSYSPKYPQGSSQKSKDWFSDYPFTHYLKQIRGLQMFFDTNNQPFWKWKTFYNEREWRYFPPDVGIEIMTYKHEKELESRRQLLNQGRLPFLLFDSSWIEYIMIYDHKDLKPLMSILKSPKYIMDYDLLLTKVITFKQIQKDF